MAARDRNPALPGMYADDEDSNRGGKPLQLGMTVALGR